LMTKMRNLDFENGSTGLRDHEIGKTIEHFL
jgi:hypothetical protein